MKKYKRIIMIFVITIVTANFGIAQDVITLKNGTDINALVQEIGDVEVKYKKYDNPNGPNYTLKKTEILIIRYANGSKDMFSDDGKQPVETKEVSILESTSVKNNESKEIVYLPENMQSRKDVIVQLGRGGFQTTITAINFDRIYYIKYKKNGKEKSKNIKQKKVAYTFSFSEKAKQKMYPIQMEAQEFLSLPIYFDKHNNWLVFGTNGMSPLSLLRKTYPDIYNNYMKGKKQYANGNALSTVGIIISPIGFLPGLVLSIVGGSLQGNGIAKIGIEFMNYYRTCIKLETLDKYGIVITPYRANPLTF